MPISNWASVEVSEGSSLSYLAVDNDPDTWWSPENFAPQWLEIEFPKGTSARVDRIELITSQVAPGPATHRVRLEDAEGKIVTWHRFDRKLSRDGDSFILRIDPPVYASSVRVLTTRYEGWVAYRELRIFGFLDHPRFSTLTTGLSRPV